MFSNLGRGMLDNVWQGYNCSLFAYGQTGSGKSYSVMGSDVNRGKLPNLLSDNFEISVVTCNSLRQCSV